MAKKNKQRSKQNDTKQKPSVKNVLQDQILSPLAAKKRDWMIALFLGLFAGLLYLNTANHEYVYDDGTVIDKNKVVTGGFKNLDLLFTKPYRYGFGNPNKKHKHYRPLPLLMYMTEWTIAPKQPWLSHCVNILMYAFTGGFIFLFFRSVFAKYSTILALIVSVLFIVHPLHTEVVANIKEREGMMAFLFSMGAVWTAVNYLKTNHLKHLAYSAFLIFCACLCKEISVTITGVMILTFMLLNESKAIPFKQIGIASAAFIIPIGLFLVIRQLIIGESGLEGTDNISSLDNIIFDADTGLERFYTAVTLLFKYLKLHVIPHPLIADYSKAAVEVIKTPTLITLVSIITHAGLLGYGLYTFFTKRTLLSWGILFYFITIALVSNVFIAIGTSFGERLMYFPSYGFCIAAGILLLKAFKLPIKQQSIALLPVFKKNIAFTGVIGLLVLLFSFKTITRNPDWKDFETLCAVDVKKNPGSARLNAYHANNIMSEENYYGKTQTEKEAIDIEAEASLKKALAVHPKFALALERFGMTFYRKNQLDSAIVYFDKALKADTSSTEAMNNKAAILFGRGKVAEAETLIEKSLRIDSLSRDGNFNRGNIYGQKGDYPNALKYLKKAIDIDDEHASSYSYIGITYFNIQQYDEAKEYLNKAIALDATNTQPVNFLALIEFNKRNYQGCLDIANRGLNIKPNDPILGTTKARALFEQGKYKEAEAVLAPIINANQQDYTAIAKMGHVYYETKQYDKSLQFLQAAIGKKQKEIIDYWYIGMALYANGEHAKGINSLKTLLPPLENMVNNGSKDANVYKYLSSIYQYTGQNNKVAEMQSMYQKLKK